MAKIVEEVDPKSELEWASKNGKWFIDFCSNDYNLLKIEQNQVLNY